MASQRDTLEAWKYLVDDFLEIACFVNESERGFLIEKIAGQNFKPGNISRHTSFLVSGKLVSFVKKENIEEFWIYDSRKKKIRQFKLVETA